MKKSEEIELLEAARESEAVALELEAINAVNCDYVEAAIPTDEDELLAQTKLNLGKSMWYISERITKRQKMLNKLHKQINLAFERELEIVDINSQSESRIRHKSRAVTTTLTTMQKVREYCELDKGYLDILYKYCMTNVSESDGLELIRGLFKKDKK